MKEKQVKEAFEKQFGGEYRFFAAPGRINLIGEHTDYNEGFVMPAAIDKRISLAMAPVRGGDVTIYSLDFNETVNFSIYEPAKDLPHWAKYPYGVIKEIQGAGYFVEGFQAAFGGDIPKGAGLSSSAALESAFATALNTIFKLQIDKLTLARLAQKAEHNYAGVKCGIMDQFASIYGKAGHVIRLDCRSLEFDYFPLELDGYELILADTRVKHSLASSQYNVRRQQCEEGVQIIAKHKPGVKSLRDVEPEDVYPLKEKMSNEVFMRCTYVTEENRRVGAMAEALHQGDMALAGKLLYQSHEGLSQKYHVSCPELDLLVDTARNTRGAMGARMMGGGFGGCTINLVRSKDADHFRQELTTAFREKFGKEPIFYRVNIGDGAKEWV